MSQERRDAKKEHVVHGVYPENNFGGLEISIDDGSDYVFYRANYGEPYKWHRAKLHYSITECRPYFRAFGRRVHLDEVLRVEAK